MRSLAWLGVTIGCVLATYTPSAAAFECPKHITEAQSVIDKVTEDMEGMGDSMDKTKMALVHALLDDAKMLLAGAEHNHEKPQGQFDHARAIAKADSARGHATAADLLHLKLMMQN